MILSIGCAPLCSLLKPLNKQSGISTAMLSSAGLWTRWRARCSGGVHLQDAEWRHKHSCRVQTLILQLLEAGTLRTLQVAAVHSSLCIDIGCLAASGLQHLALACERLRLEGRRGNSSSPPVPSIHLFTWVRFPESKSGCKPGCRQLPPDHQCR